MFFIWRKKNKNENPWVLKIMLTITEILKIFIYIIDHILPPLYHSGNLEGIQIELKVINELMKKYNKRYKHIYLYAVF